VSEISQPDRRTRLAEFMVSLSRNHSLADFLAVRTREFYDAISVQYLGRDPSDRGSAREHLLRWGIGNAAGVGGVRIEGAPPHMEEFMNETLKHPLISMRTLARVGNAEDAAAGRAMDERWRAAEEEVRNEVAGLSEDEVWKRESWHTMMHGENRKRLQEVARLLDTDWNYLKSWLWDDENRVNVMRAVPSLSVPLRLRRARARNPQHRTHPNDLKDLIYLGSTLPYANIIVTDKAWAHVATQAGFDSEFGTQICRSVLEVPGALDALLGVDGAGVQPPAYASVIQTTT
jgi:hypothetical protein